MLIRIKENDGTETLLFEGADNIATDMITFFRREIGLTANVVSDGDEDWTKEQFQSTDNQKRAMNFKAEYVKFGMKLLKTV